MEPKYGSEAATSEPKNPATVDADADDQAPSLENTAPSGRAAETMSDQAKDSTEQRSASRLSKNKCKSVASRRSQRRGARKHEGKTSEREESKPTAQPQRLFGVTSPSTLESGAQYAIGSGRRDGVQTNQDKVTVGSTVSPAGSRSTVLSPGINSATVVAQKPRLAHAMDAASLPTTRVIGKRALPKTDAKPECAAQPVSRATQCRNTLQEPPIMPSVTPRDTNRPTKSPVMQSDGSGLSALVLADFPAERFDKEDYQVYT
ncbi:hypothetical protein MTO96_021071 [Rhipicephalus appendiculatus]